MPMASQVGGVAGHGDVMAQAHRDALVATGADVFLHRLIGLHPTHFHRPVEAVPDAEAPAGGRHRLSR